MDFKLKTISKAGIPEAISKVELYRSLNEPEEAESICRDILAADPEHQLALRLLGLSITDQFCGDPSDRYKEVEELFQRLGERYERLYYMGLLHERRAKAQMRLGRPPHSLAPLSFRGATYSGVFTLLPMLTGRGREHHGEILRAVAALVDSGVLRPMLDEQVYTLSDTADAHAAVESGTRKGKVVVSVRG